MFKFDSIFMHFMTKLVSFFWLIILALICSIPIITAGASITAMYSVSLKFVKNEEGGITRGFFIAFKQNFVKSTILWLIMVVVLIIVIIDFLLFYAGGSAFSEIMKSGLVVISLLILSISSYILPMQSRFENSVINQLKNSIFISVKHLPTSILLLGIYLFPFTVSKFMPNAVAAVAIAYPALLVFLKSILLRRVFDTYTKTEISIEDDLSV